MRSCSAAPGARTESVSTTCRGAAVASAEQVFRDGTDARRGMLRAAWPELFEALGGETGKPAGPQRTQYCPSTRHLDLPVDERPPVVARLYRNAGPACADCVERFAGRPGGYPLALTLPEEFR